MSPNRRVVCTGIGILSPLAANATSSWQALISSRCGVVPLKPEHSYDGNKSKVAAYVPQDELDALSGTSKHQYMTKHAKQLSKAAKFAMLAAHEALEDAKLLDTNGHLQERYRLTTGVTIGQGMVDFHDIYENGCRLNQPSGYRRMSPFFITRALMNMSAGNISIRYKISGPNHCVSTACATGAHSIGDAFQFIKSGRADVMICGSTEASINSIAMAGFDRLKALNSQSNDYPTNSSRPFDTNRAGFVMGEGAGVLILEELDHAKNRGLDISDIYAEILGYGLSADAHHLTAPLPDGQGAKFSMISALKDANLPKTSISYINAHATSTPLGDDIEANAIEDLFASKDSRIKVSSFKGSIGHLLGGAGSVETILALLCCKHSLIPHTLNLKWPLATAKDLVDFVTYTPRSWTDERRILVKNSFGFGGTNASLVIAAMSKQ